MFSCLSAFLGVGVIAWYGAGEIGKREPKSKGAIVRDALTGREVEVGGEAEGNKVEK